MKIHYLYYEARPKPGSDRFETVGGAFVSCWIRAFDQNSAENAALADMDSRDFEPIALLEARVVIRNDYRNQLDWLEYFEEAESDGESFLYNAWPPEAQDGDAIH